jgi:biopolymer transport protein ExbD
LETPKQLTLPASVVEEKPRETVVIFVSSTEVTVQGERVALIEDILAADGQNVAAIGERLSQLSDTIIGLSTRSMANSREVTILADKSMANSREVTILADKSVPFNVVKKVMSTCTSQGFERISLAVIQRAPESAQG